MGGTIGVIIPIGVGGLVAFSLWFWAVLDVIATDSILCRNLPKQTWIILVIFLPTVGALAWILLGRPEGAGMALGGQYRPPDYTQHSRRRGIEDSPDWNAQTAPSAPGSTAGDDDVRESTAAKERRLLEWEAELAKREAAIDDDPPTSAGD